MVSHSAELAPPNQPEIVSVRRNGQWGAFSGALFG